MSRPLLMQCGTTVFNLNNVTRIDTSGLGPCKIMHELIVEAMQSPAVQSQIPDEQRQSPEMLRNEQRRRGLLYRAEN